jgi:hypothetical protein
MPDPRPWEAIRHLNHLHFAGGFVGGLAARMATIPLEAALTQTQPNRILDPPTQARLARHGRSMITLGLSACPRLAAFHGAQFMVAGAVDAVFFPDEQPGGQVLPGQQPPTVPEYMAQHFACGALGTAAAALMCAPFDAIDHHITFRNKTFLGAIQAVWHEGGLRGFYARSPPVLGTALLYGGDNLDFALRRPLGTLRAESRDLSNRLLDLHRRCEETEAVIRSLMRAAPPGVPPVRP